MAQSNGGWFQADSAAEAVRKAFSGTFASDIDGVTHSFPNYGAFRYDPDYTNWDGVYVGRAVVFDAGYGYGNDTTPGDARDDVYIPVNVQSERLWVQATTDATDMPSLSDLSLPSGSVIVGRLTPGDPNTPATELSATVRWPDTNTTTATITPWDGLYYIVSVIPPSGQSASNPYTITLSHSYTGTTYTNATDGTTTAPTAATPVAHQAAVGALKLTVTTNGGSPTKMPTNQFLTWNAIPGATSYVITPWIFDSAANTYRLDTAHATTINATSWQDSQGKIPTPPSNKKFSPNNAGPSRFYQVNALNAAGVNLAATVNSAPRFYYIEGAGHETSVKVQEMYDYYTSGEMSTLRYEAGIVPTTLPDIAPPPGAQPSPINLIGVSVGGAAAVNLANNLSDAQVNVAYLNDSSKERKRSDLK